MDVPQALTRYFADSNLRLLSYDSDSNVLSVHIEKDIGPESGIISFNGVSYVAIPDCFSGDAIDALFVRDADDAFWQRTSCHTDCVEPTQTIYRIYDQDGPVHFVVAESINYEIDANSGAGG